MLIVLLAILIIALLVLNITNLILFPEYIWELFLLGFFLLFLCFLAKNNLKELNQKKKIEKTIKDLEKANLKFKKLSKTKSEFISIASHQLRTPLSIIIGYLSMINEGIYGKAPKKMIKPMSNAFIASQQLNKLVSTLLSISRIEAGKIKLETKKTSIAKIIKPIVKEFKIVAQKKDLYLKLSIPSSLPLVLLDKEKIDQVIINVIDNAIKYTEAGGIDIKTVELKKKKKILIKITDTGLGLEKKQIKQIFQKFKRGTAGEMSWSSGAGLGLFISKKFIELHKGKIWAESQGINKGSTFCIELPTK
ncbi:MAG: HAMP domain-containing sensor histidine kinase [Patescibacteria group bacterium]|nr:HAMP domain-containing sensor histidine kinase [Patescibacteria group bacterium]